MKNIFKKTSVAVLAAATILSAMPVFGANANWSFTAQTPGGAYRTNGIYKTTNSSVLVNYSSGPSSYVSATAWTYVNGVWKDCTYYNSNHPYYRAYKGSNFIDVLNTINEKYGNRNASVYLVAPTAGTHSGKWRPDL